MLSWARETEAREAFPVGGDRTSGVVPDASVVIRAGEAQYHALVEVDDLEAEEAALAQEGPEDASEPLTAVEIEGWARELRRLLEEGSPQQRKALLRKLVKELRVTGPRRVEPTYKVPALVRAPGRQVEVARGCVNCLPLLSALDEHQSA